MSNIESPQPYLLRAFYEWIVDNKWTPYILVDANCVDVVVPQSCVSNNKIVLNIAMYAVNKLLLDNDTITFQARFAGRVESLYIPVAAVQAIYAKENGRGMVFPDEGVEPLLPGRMPFLPNISNVEENTDGGDDNNGGGSKGKGGKGRGKGHLRVIK